MQMHGLENDFTAYIEHDAHTTLRREVTDDGRPGYTFDSAKQKQRCRHDGARISGADKRIGLALSMQAETHMNGRFRLRLDRGSRRIVHADYNRRRDDHDPRHLPVAGQLPLQYL